MDHNLEWMIKEIQLQIKSVKKQINGLPENIRKQVMEDAINTLSFGKELISKHGQK